mmetsp:Transcript_70230/g.131327  ORF Transcript_70230/g.131327 Transcript_70230/m.131327 type:complete len:225 (-) Transcript_70230:38-712(-)
MPRSSSNQAASLVLRRLLCLLVACFLGARCSWHAGAFTGRSLCTQAPLRKALRRRALPPFEPFLEPVEAYAAARVADSPFLADLPPEVVHWGHAGAMLSVYPMIFVAAYSAWLTQQGRGDEELFSMGIPARVLHPAQALGATIFFIIGGQGGLVLLKAQGQPILDSPHAVTAVLLLLGLLLQALSALLFPAAPSLRSWHAVVGTVTVATLILHAVFGVSLGLSF